MKLPAFAVLSGCLWTAVCCAPLAFADPTQSNAPAIEVKDVPAKPGDPPKNGEIAKPAAPAPAAVPAATPAPGTPATPPAPESKSDAKTPVAADSDALRLYMLDGSVITGALAIKELPVETKFGSLSVPVDSIRSFTPGLASHPVLAKQIAKFIEDLGSGQFNDRDAAQQALQKMGPQVRKELERRKDDPDAERRTRVRAILAEFDQAQDDQEEAATADKSEGDNTPFSQGDTVVTSEFTIVGHIVPESFAVTSVYGPLTIKMADIRRVQRGMPKKDDLPTNFTVSGTHITPSGSLTTGIRLERGDIVSVSASGTMVMSPWGNGAQTTPDGSTNYGQINRGIPVGALVGRVGNNQEWFKIGSKSTFTADKSGVLQLAVAMQPQQAGNDFPGHYSVKVRVVRK